MSNDDTPWKRAQKFALSSRPIGPIHSRPGQPQPPASSRARAPQGKAQTLAPHQAAAMGVRVGAPQGKAQTLAPHQAAAMGVAVGVRGGRTRRRVNTNTVEGGVHVKTMDRRDSYDREIFAHRTLEGLDVTPTLISFADEKMELRTTRVGRPMDSVFGKGKKPPLAIIDALFDCVAAMHQAGIAHRDLHCRNVMVQGARVRLIDFEWSHIHYGPLRKSPDLAAGHPAPGYWQPRAGRHWDDRNPRNVAALAGPMAAAYERYLKRLRIEIARVTGYLPNKRHSRSGEVYQSVPWIGIADDKAQRQTKRRIETLGLHEFVKGAPVLDLGCNLGAISVACAEAGAAAVVGVELDQGRVAVARKIAAVAGVHDRVHFTRGNLVESLRELEGPFDGVILALAVDAHVPDANEFYRLLGAAKPETLILESNKHRGDPGPIRAVLGEHFSSFEVLGDTKHEDKFGNSRMILRMRR